MPISEFIKFFPEHKKFDAEDIQNAKVCNRKMFWHINTAMFVAMLPAWAFDFTVPERAKPLTFRSRWGMNFIYLICAFVGAGFGFATGMTKTKEIIYQLPDKSRLKRLIVLSDGQRMYNKAVARGQKLPPMPTIEHFVFDEQPDLSRYSEYPEFLEKIRAENQKEFDNFMTLVKEVLEEEKAKEEEERKQASPSNSPVSEASLPPKSSVSQS